MNIVITGASRGIGYQVAVHFARMGGNRVFALSRNSEGLHRLVKEGGNDIVAIECDLTKEEKVEEAVQAIRQSVDSLEILINNAGRLINKPFVELTVEDWKGVYDVNVFGLFSITKKLLPLLKEGKLLEKDKINSHILNVSSMGGIQGSLKFKGLSAYSSSKGAVITMTECLSEELKDMGIRVNSIALGSVETEMFSSAFPGAIASVKSEEIAKWIMEFAGEGCKFFNGKILPVSTSTP